jgi:hypothetical protein
MEAWGGEVISYGDVMNCVCVVADVVPEPDAVGDIRRGN